MTTPEKICAMVHERAATGLAKYGVTVDRDDLTHAQWATHAQEELLDAAQYLQREKEKFAEEIEKAYLEGNKAGVEDFGSWEHSRAKRVAEGVE